MINPLVPYVNDFQKRIPTIFGSRVRRVSDMGYPQVGYQAFKLLAHARLHEHVKHWRERYPGVEELKVAVMGCIVNGPGESKHADIGISLPGTGEMPTAPVFIDGQKAATLRGPSIAEDFQKMVSDYIEQRFGRGRAAAE